MLPQGAPASASATPSSPTRWSRTACGTSTRTSTWATPPSSSRRSTTSPAARRTTYSPRTATARPRKPAGGAASSTNEIVPDRGPAAEGRPRRLFNRTKACGRARTAEKLGKLRPAFKRDGTVTAANASQISDGGAAVVVMEEERAKRSAFKPARAHHRLRDRRRRAQVGHDGAGPGGEEAQREARHDRGRLRPRGAERGVLLAGVRRHARTQASIPRRSTSTAARWPSATRSAPPGCRILVTLLHAMADSDAQDRARDALSRRRQRGRPFRGARHNLMLGVVGAGTMGNGIAQVFAHGHDVVLVDVNDEAAVSKSARRHREEPRPFREEGEDHRGRGEGDPRPRSDTSTTSPTSPTRTWSSRRSSRTSTIKEKVFGALDEKRCQRTTILASNTSSIWITQIGGRDQPAGQGDRHALHEPGADDEAGRGHPRPGHLGRDDGEGARAPRFAGQDAGRGQRLARGSSRTAS